MAARRGAVVALIAALVCACVAPPARSADGGLALGDSITVGAAPQLAAAGLEVDAEVGRSFAQGLAILQARGSHLPSSILVNLGTNSGVTRSQCDQLLSIVGSGRALTLVTVNIPAAPKVAAASNEVLSDCAARGGATLLDWAGYVAAHPGVVCGDGIHISCGGAGQYARFVLSGAARAPAPKAAPAPAGVDEAPSRPAGGTGGTRSPVAERTGPSAAQQAALAAAAQEARLEAERVAAAQAEAARLAAEQRQRQLDYLHLIGGPEAVVGPAGSDQGRPYEFVPVAVRLSLLANS